MQGRTQVSAGDVGDHRVGGARGTIAATPPPQLQVVTGQPDSPAGEARPVSGRDLVLLRNLDRHETSAADRKDLRSRRRSPPAARWLRPGEMLTRDLTDDRGVARSC